MSERDQLREALAEHFYVEAHGRSVASWSEVVVMENADRTWHVAAVYRARADAVLAVLDQQGWPEGEPGEDEVIIATLRDLYEETLAERDAALREAARYEDKPSAWLSPGRYLHGFHDDTLRSHADCVPLYRRVTEGEEG